MPLVNVMVNQRAYTIACDEGEEEHLRELAKYVDSKVRELLGTVGQVGDGRLLLMAALLITDDYLDASAQLERRTQELDELTASHADTKMKLDTADAGTAEIFEAAKKRLGDIAGKLAEA